MIIRAGVQLISMEICGGYQRLKFLKGKHVDLIKFIIYSTIDNGMDVKF